VLRNKSGNPLLLSPSVELEVGGRVHAITVLSEVRLEPRSELALRAPLAIPRVTGVGWLRLLIDGDASCEARIAIYVAERSAPKPRLRLLLLRGRRASMGGLDLRVMPVGPGIRSVAWRLMTWLTHIPLLLLVKDEGVVAKLKAGRRVLVLIDEGDGVYGLEDGRLRRVLPPPPSHVSPEEWGRLLILSLLEHDAGKGREYVLVWRGSSKRVEVVKALARELSLLQ